MLKRVSSYEELWHLIDYRTFKFPNPFNLGVACVDDHDPSARALTIVARDRTSQDYTFGDVRDRANRLANSLAGLGIGRGDVVAVINPQSLETGVAFMGLFRMGAIALPLSSLFGPDALAYRLRDSGAKAVIVAAANVSRVREAIGDARMPLVVIGDGAGPDEHRWDELLATASADFAPVTTSPEDPAFLIYTSGTTGNPKGALHAHRIVFGQIPPFEAVYDFYPLPDDVLWSPADWAWIAGIMDILVPAWFYGLPVIVDTDPAAFNAERALWLIREHRVTLTLLPATALRMIRASGLPGGDFAFRAICSGGEPLGADLLAWSEEFFGCPINEAYGQTELNGICGNSARVYPVKPGSLGRALPGTRVTVLDEQGQEVVDQVGEIAVDRHTPLTMLEYWHNPDGTKDKFLGDWLLTGDLGKIDGEGYVWFESRKDDVINSAGYRIGPSEIEDCLGSHQAVAMAAVVGVPDERRGQIPKAFVVLREGVEPSDALADELRGHVRDRLARHEVPRQIEWIDELPRTTTGKIMRRALRDR
ncbi:MAG: AMP-binding protein [Acidimicrobiaceae bacterium]|nr:AMP-binding protein [Acidimicrobiaceae bacterium]